MRGSRVLVGSVAVFLASLVAAVVGINRYDDSYTWVAHTSDVRLVIGRAVGHAGRAPSCMGLRIDLAELASLTADNPVQQARLPALGESLALACANKPAPDLVDQLAALDATERSLLAGRRAHLADTRQWSLLAYVLSTLAAIAAVVLAGRLQRRAVHAVIENEERFRMLAASASDLIRIHDAAGRPTYVSPSIERLLGYTPAELLAEVPLSLGHPDDLAQMRDALVRIQQPHAPASTLVYRLRAKDGSYRWFETHTNPIRDPAGALLRFYTSARDITERVELERQLEAVAITDELTGLLNRRGFLLIAGQEHRLALRQHHGVAVIFADLDGLKTINDKLGHDHGDRAIRQLGEILRDTFRESDVVARLGGDEFAALAYNVEQSTVEAVLARVRSAVASAAPTGPYPLSVSLGAAVLAPGATGSLEELIAQADQQMYENKRARKAV